MRYAGIDTCDVVNGEGVGICLYTQGCPHHCEGCFNPETWNYNSGKLFTENEKNEILEAIDKSYISRFSLLGGEPLIKENIDALIKLIDEIKDIKPDISVWCWTGYSIEELLNDKDYDNILSKIDILVDGEFILSQKALDIAFRGSKNQRIIDVQKTIRDKQITIIDTY